MVTRLRNRASGSASRSRRSAPRRSRKPRGTDAATTIAVLARELDETRQQQAATTDVLKVISHSTYDLQSVLDKLSALAARLCEADIVTIWRPAGPGYRLVARFGTSRAHDDYMANLSLKPERGSCVGRVLLAARIVQIPDSRKDPEYTLDARRARTPKGYRKILAVPLLREGIPIGVIALGRHTVRPFTDKQIELVTTFADQAVIAIENVRLFDEVQARTRELSEALEQQTATSEILGGIAASPPNIQPVLQAGAESACRLCEAYDSVIRLCEGERLHVRAHHGPIPVDLVGSPIGRGWVTGRAFVDRKPVHVHDLQAAADEFPDGSGSGIRSGARLAVPLLRENEAIGALVIRRAEVRPFTDKQIALLTTFAHQAVIAIENVRLFDEVQARTKEIQESLEYQMAISEVLNIISRSPNELQPVLDTIVQTAARLCKAEFAAFFRLQEGKCHIGATNAEADFIKVARENPFVPTRASCTGRAVLERRTVHILD